MSVILMMELNSKSPVVWDWEDLLVFPSRGVPNKMLLVDTDIEATNDFEAGSFHSSGDHGIGGSATLAISHSFSQDLSCTKELASKPARTPSMADISIGSGESLIGLKLGKRTYFKAVSGGSSSSKESPALSNGTVKRSKVYSQSTESPCCQVEGCSVDLSSAKDYHRKHRVCETHSKSSKVIIRGLERRFCQQCSRFHSMSEFDQKKRSCRRRLSDHNARRRKPKPEIIQFNSRTLHSSLHEGRNEISFAFNQVPLIETRPDSNSKLIQGRVGLFSPIKTACSNELQATWIKPQETRFTDSYGSTQTLQFKEAPVEVLHLHQGLLVSTTGNSLDAAAQNPSALSLLSTNSWGLGVPGPAPPPMQLQLQHHHHHHHGRSLGLPPVSTEYWEQSSHHALSLLSSHSWGSCEPDPTPPPPPPPLDQFSMVPHHHQNRPLGLPPVSAGYWQKQSISVPTIQNDENITHFQQSQLKERNESSFYMY